jgi:hypothetical protein
MVHALTIWLLVAAFFGAGVFNAIGTSGTQSDFARWGYPSWWNVFTDGLEIMSAVLIALLVSRAVGRRPSRGLCKGNQGDQDAKWHKCEKSR